MYHVALLLCIMYHTYQVSGGIMYHTYQVSCGRGTGTTAHVSCHVS